MECPWLQAMPGAAAVQGHTRHLRVHVMCARSCRALRCSPLRRQTPQRHAWRR
jgi:hypothetical protein